MVANNMIASAVVFLKMLFTLLFSVNHCFSSTLDRAEARENDCRHLVLKSHVAFGADCIIHLSGTLAAQSSS
jgi:hypothetical protein